MNKKNKLKPIKYYINDKEELINQVFSCISEKQIKKMTPSSLTDMSIDELKAECLVQLLKMSNKKIIRILNGLKNYRSEKKGLDENCKANEAENAKSEILEHQKGKTEKEQNKEKTLKENEEIYYNETSEVRTSVKRKYKEKKHKEKKKKRKRNDEDGVDDAESKGRNLLELLELEMRAKAIRSLLKKEEELEKLNEVITDSSLADLSNQKKDLLSKDKKMVERKYILQKEMKVVERRKENKVGNMVNKTKTSHHQSITKDFKRITSDNKAKNIKEEKVENNVNEKSCILKNEKVNCDWNVDEEKLIYEDDEYDSDDKVGNDISKEGEKSEENSTSSWAERWLQSKDVKRVVATSKMLTVVRNKMKNNFKSNNKKSSNNTNLTTIPRLELEGSVKEYDTLLQMNEAVMADAKMRTALKKQFNI